MAREEKADFWQSVADNIPQLAWVADADGFINWYNRRWYDFTGTNLAEMKGWGWQSVHHPDHVDRVVHSFNAAIEAGEVWEDTFPLRSASGEYREFLSRANPIRDATGRITHWFGTNTDITDQLATERALRASEAQARQAAEELEAIYSAAPVGLAVFDRDLRYVRINRLLADVNGYSPDEHLGRSIRDIVPELADQLEDGLRKVLSGAEIRGAEVTGSTVSLPGVERTWRENWVPFRDTSGEIVGVAVSAEDVTDEKETARRIREAEARYRAVFEQARVGVARVSPDGPFLEINDRFCEILKRSREDIVGGGWREITHPDDLAFDSAQVARMVAGELESYSLEKRYLAPDGSPIWVNLTVAAERDADGKILFFIPVVEDIGERKAAEQALRDSEALTRRISDVAPCILYVYDLAEERNVWGNREMVELLGYSAEELAARAGNLVGDLLHPDDAESYAQHRKKIMELSDGEAANLRYRFRKADGGWVWLDSYDMVFRSDDAGRPIQIIGAALDVSEQHAATEALRKSELRYRALFESMEQGFSIIQVSFDGDEATDYRFVELNPAFSEHTGLSADVLNRSVREAVPGLEASWFERYGRVARTGTPTRFTDYAKPLNRWFDVYAFRIGDAAERNVAILFTDITERVRQDEALRSSEARLRAVLDSAPVGLLFADADGRITGVNANVERVIGKPVVWSESVGGYSADYVAYHADGRQVQSEEYPLAKVLAGEADRAELTCRVERADGSLSWVRYVAGAIRDEQGDVSGGVVASIDIDREQRLTESLEREVEKVVREREAAQEALRQSQKLEAMGQLTGGVAHDFNNLLTPIIGSLDLLQRKEIGDDRTRRLVDGALQSAERAKMLVQRLLAFARRQPLQATAVDVGRVVTEMGDLISSTSGPRVRLEVDVEPELPPAHADANQLEMALLNLSVNARDAMPDGGTLGIRVDCREQVPADLTGLAGARHVVLTVSDTGTGMDEETRARAIEPFFSTKGLGKGTGLGLSMVHGLAAQLGGALRIESAPEKGTRIELWLPVSDAMPDSDKPAAMNGIARGKGMVLLVDDELLVRTSTASMLADLGYSVSEAESAEEALKLVRDGLRPDLLVTDQLMPGMSGTDLAVKLRRSMPLLPVLIVSGYAEAESLSPGFPHLSKPFRQADLAASVEAISGTMVGAT